MELHPHEIKILKSLKKRSSPEDIAKKSGLEISAIMRASSWLATKGLVKIEEKIIEEISLGNEGIVFFMGDDLINGQLYERKIIDAMYLFRVPTEFETDLKEAIISDELKNIFETNKKPLSESATIKKVEGGWQIVNERKIYFIGRENEELKTYKGELNISELKSGEFDIGLGVGWLKKKNLAIVEKGKITLIRTNKTEDEKLLKLLKELKKDEEVLTSDDLTPEQKEGLELLKTRQDVIKISERKKIWLSPTQQGMEIAGKTDVGESISQLTPELLISGKWKKKKFRAYDIGIYVNPRYPAKRHPLQKVLDEIREICMRMGFEEVNGPMVESAFWNFDALFQPQDHPARDMHDTFYLKQPAKVEIPGWDEFKQTIKETHERGWKTGSIGWDYEWDEKIAQKSLLRTHTTSVSARYLSELTEDRLPVKIFSIDKNFRNESIDYKHLPEFYQVEGIVVDKNVNFRNLLGILKQFYDDLGFKVRFRPAYFPYTEPSLEVEAWVESRGEWIELGGAGIFRPEVVQPLLGFECPVLAWGLGLDRLVALKLGLEDIRELYRCDLDWLRKNMA